MHYVCVCLATLVALCTSLLLSSGWLPIRNPSSKFDHLSSFVHVFVFVFSVFFVICLRPTALGLAVSLLSAVFYDKV